MYVHATPIRIHTYADMHLPVCICIVQPKNMHSPTEELSVASKRNKNAAIKQNHYKQ